MRFKKYIIYIFNFFPSVSLFPADIFLSLQAPSPGSAEAVSAFSLRSRLWTLFSRLPRAQGRQGLVRSAERLGEGERARIPPGPGGSAPQQVPGRAWVRKGWGEGKWETKLEWGQAGPETGTDQGERKWERGQGRGQGKDGDTAGTGMRKMGNDAGMMTRQR